MSVVNTRALVLIGCVMALPMPAFGSDMQPAEAATPADNSKVPTQRGVAIGARALFFGLGDIGDQLTAGYGAGIAGEAFYFATSNFAFGAQAGTMGIYNAHNEFCHTCTRSAHWAVALGELRAPTVPFTPYFRLGGGYGHSVEDWDPEEHDHFALQMEGGVDFHPRSGLSLRALVQLFALPGADDFPAVGTGVQLGFEPSP